MKKIILTLLLSIPGLFAFAANPVQPLLQAFDGRYNNSKGVTLREISQPDNYFYSIEVKENPVIVKQLIEWLNESRKYSDNEIKTISNGQYRYNIDIENDKKDKISIGAEYNNDQTYARFYLQSNEPFDNL